MAIRVHKRQSANPTLKTQNCKRKAQDTTTYVFFILLGGFWRAGEWGGRGRGLPQLTLQKVVSCELKSHEARWC
jgi:hypothetical protein